MNTIATVPATAPPNSAPESGSPPERAGAPGDFAATLTNIASARTAPAEGHKETDKPAADDQSTAGDRDRESQSALDPAAIVLAPAAPALPAVPAKADKTADQGDDSALDQATLPRPPCRWPRSSR